MKITAKEAQIRYNRLDALRVMTENFEEGEGRRIADKAYRAENQTDSDFTGIIRLTANEKEFLGYILSDNEFLSDYEKEVLKFYIG